MSRRRDQRPRRVKEVLVEVHTRASQIARISGRITCCFHRRDFSTGFDDDVGLVASIEYQ